MLIKVRSRLAVGRPAWGIRSAGWGVWMGWRGVWVWVWILLDAIVAREQANTLRPQAICNILLALARAGLGLSHLPPPLVRALAASVLHEHTRTTAQWTAQAVTVSLSALG